MMGLPYKIIDVTDIVPARIMYLIPHVATLYSVLKRVYHEEFIQAPDNITQCIRNGDV